MKNLTLTIIYLMVSFNLYAAEIYEIDINEINVNNVGQSIQRFDLLCIENTDCSVNLHQDAFSSTEVDYEQIKMLTTQFSYRPLIVGGGLFLVHKDDLSISNGFLYFNVLGSTAAHKLVGYADTKFLVKVAKNSNLKNIDIVMMEPLASQIEAVFGTSNEEADDDQRVMISDGIDGTLLGTIPGDWLDVNHLMLDIYGETGFASHKMVGYYLDGVYVEGSLGSLNALLNSGAVKIIYVRP